MRKRAAIVLNLLIPGTGMIVARREWLGAALAILYGVLLELGLWGCLIEPMRVSKWAAVAFLFGAAIIWIAGQVLLGRRLPDLSNPQIEREIERLREEVIALTSGQQYEQAWATLRMALSADDENLETNVLTAELMTALGRFSAARRAWRRVEQLDRLGTYRRHLAEALSRLPGR